MESIIQSILTKCIGIMNPSETLGTLHLHLFKGLLPEWIKWEDRAGSWTLDTALQSSAVIPFPLRLIGASGQNLRDENEMMRWWWSNMMMIWSKNAELGSHGEPHGTTMGSLRIFHGTKVRMVGELVEIWGDHQIVRRCRFQSIPKLVSLPRESQWNPDGIPMESHGWPLQAKEQRPIPRSIHARIPVVRWNMILAHRLQKHSCQIFLHRWKFAARSARCWNVKREMEGNICNISDHEW